MRFGYAAVSFTCIRTGSSCSFSSLFPLVRGSVSFTTRSIIWQCWLAVGL